MYVRVGQTLDQQKIYQQIVLKMMVQRENKQKIVRVGVGGEGGGGDVFVVAGK
jgi:hypothetical protein